MSDHPHRLGCQRTDHPSIGRRELVQAGGMALFGMGMADLLRMDAQASVAPGATPARAKSVIFIFQSGGPSQHETWDPKPDAPAEIRGEYGTIATTVPGLRICEYLPKLAARSDRYAIIRTMYHPAERQFRNEHSAAQYMLHTGRTNLPPGQNTNTIGLANGRRFDWPSIGSLLAYALPHVAGGGLPSVVEIPRAAIVPAGDGPGMLGSRYDRWRVDLAPPCYAKDPAGSCPNCFSHDQPDDPERAPGKGPKAWWDNTSCRKSDFRLPDFRMPQGLSVSQLENRAALLGKLNNLKRGLDLQNSVRRYDVYQRQALELVVTQNGRRNSFDLSQEPDRTRLVRTGGMGPGLPGGAAVGRGRSAHGPDQPARLGHASKRLSRSQGQVIAVDRPLFERVAR